MIWTNSVPTHVSLNVPSPSPLAPLQPQPARRPGPAAKKGAKQRPTPGGSTPSDNSEEAAGHVLLLHAAKKVGVAAVAGPEKGRGVTTSVSAKRPPARKSILQKYSGYIKLFLLTALVVAILKLFVL